MLSVELLTTVVFSIKIHVEQRVCFNLFWHLNYIEIVCV